MLRNSLWSTYGSTTYFCLFFSIHNSLHASTPIFKEVHITHWCKQSDLARSSTLFLYSSGLNSVPHTLTSEMYSTKVRGLGSSISLITAWLSGLLSILVSGYLNFYLGGHYTFWLFGGVNAAAFVFVVLFIPETTAKTLTEIDYMMAQWSKILLFSDWKLLYSFIY